jgi:hypothetical protein
MSLAGMGVVAWHDLAPEAFESAIYRLEFTRLKTPWSAG